MAVLCFMLGISCYFDYRKGKIPNFLLVMMLIAGCGYRAIDGGGRGVGIFLLTGAGIVLLLSPLFRIGALGAGDVKLYGICAGYLPWNKFLLFLFFSLLIAAVISLFKMVLESNAIERISYLCEYVAEVVRTGKFYLYIENNKERRAAGICLAGPIFLSLLLYLGGVY